MTSSVESVNKLPAYLQRYCVEQQPAKYTPRDQAAWRFIMRQSRTYFAKHGVPVYLEGLRKTGIAAERIPLVSEMDRSLRELGWGAVPVCGFIPPAAFLDFQARRILPIATDMRSPDHIHYTPAPDIVHEAAGHAPIIADPAYSEYLTRYAAMAQKAVFSREDLELYEAIRSLSDTKENPDSTPAMIKDAEAKLAAAVAATTFISEATKVARMKWWTVEYGLLGSLEAPKIYGAGLLSSIGESQHCLDPKVRKIRLSTRCVETSYDITEPQPQLFVAEDIKHLTDVLAEFEASLAFRRGGTYGLEQALAGRTVTTTVLDSGLEISGQLTEFKQVDGRIEFLRYGGPVQLAAGGRELSGQGVAQHPQGFSTPLGRFKERPDVSPRRLPASDLAALGLVAGRRGRLELVSGFLVEGELVAVERLEGALALLKWRDCRVTRGGEAYFEPAWGDFDMAIGETVTSVFGGPADRERFGDHDVGRATTTPGRKTPFTPQETATFAVYQEVRDLREALTKSASPAQAPTAAQRERAAQLVAKIEREFPDEWLLRLEGVELAYRDDPGGGRASTLQQALQNDAAKFGQDTQWLIRQGLQLAARA
jgi:phenylalanine-4-hydroxylase